MYINISPEAQEVKDMFVKEEEEEVEEHIYEEEKVPMNLRVPNIAPAPIWNNVAETGFSEDVHQRTGKSPGNIWTVQESQNFTTKFLFSC